MLALVVLAAAVTLGVLVGGRGGSATGRIAPPLPRQVLQGPRVTLAALRGRPAIVNFFASWCEPCQREAPQMATLSRRLHGSARLVGIAWSDERAAAASFTARHGFRFPVLLDPNGEVGDSYGIVGLPSTFILSAQGRILRRLSGPQSATAVLAALPR
jgi:cytochrome c biogenesis protein CcmG/thiol:disulfide interchange protein DsbE